MEILSVVRKVIAGAVIAVSGTYVLYTYIMIMLL